MKSFLKFLSTGIPGLSGIFRLTCVAAASLYAAGPAPAADYYTEPPLFALRPDPKSESNFGSVGVTGLKLRVYPGVVLKVVETLPGTPADGKFAKDEIITGVNGTELNGRNPYLVLGMALTQAEATEGNLVFDVLSSDGKNQKRVALNIPVLGTYSPTWPLNCRKSQAIIKQAADYYAKHEANGVEGALRCLFLLSTGDDQYLPVVKAYFDKMAVNPKGIGGHTWFNGYNGIACAEYYLRTGDSSVLPILQQLSDDASEGQAYGIAWAHSSHTCNPNYMQGVINAASVQVLTTMLLAKECGVRVDDKALMGSLKFYYRFAGNGTVPYGDHRAEGGLGSNGKDGMAAASMRIASEATGDVSIYQKARDAFAMSMLDSYPCMITGHGDDGRGDAIWRALTASYLMDLKPSAYRYHMNGLRWWFDLSRRPSGALGIASCQSFDDEASGAATALAYTAPLKTLRITGAPRSKHAKEFTLPAHLWGRKADLDFLSIKDGKPYSKAGADEPIHVPFWKFGSAYNRPADSELAKIPREEMVRNVYHRNYMIRAQAAKGLMRTGALDVLEKLLQDQDARVRRAALDGLIDYDYFFAMGRNPIQPGAVTPEMLASFRKMLADPEEAIYVVDGALMAMSCAPVQEIANSLPLIQPWTTYDEWWVRQSAFVALAKAAEDASLAPKILPILGEMLWRENRPAARGVMSARMSQLAKKYPPDSEPGKQIAAIFKKTVAETPIEDGFRAGAGGYFVKADFLAALDFDPGTWLDLATILGHRLQEMRTDYLVTLTDKLLAVYAQTPEPAKAVMTDLLYGEFRNEFIRRMNAGDMQLNQILALTALKKPNSGWHVLGKEPLTEREWRYTTFNPLPKDEMTRKEGRRMRDVTLPDSLRNWFVTDFDDQAWNKGRGPIGVGKWTGDINAYDANGPGKTFANRSPWGDGEFLVMRNEFHLDSLDYDFIRLRVLALQGYRIYLNGQEIGYYFWYELTPKYSERLLGPGERQHLKLGRNVLAAYTPLVYWEGLPPGRRYLVDTKTLGQMDLYLEGLRKADLFGEGNERK